MGADYGGALGVDARGEDVADLDGAFHDLAVVAEHVGLDLQRVGDDHARRAVAQLAGIADLIRTRGASNMRILVMCGAGISTSAGIPDFRTPGTGLYDNLQEYDLPDPQSIFEINYFQRRPQGFKRESVTITPVEAPDMPSRWAWIAKAGCRKMQIPLSSIPIEFSQKSPQLNLSSSS